MARTHGRVMARIWNDPEFLALSVSAQRLYIFLVSQADLTHAGVLALRRRRWAKSAAGFTATDLDADLNELERTRFVLLDEDTEEVLVRTLIRNDGIYKQPNLMLAVVREAGAIQSQQLRDALADELAKLPMDELSDVPGKAGGKSQRAAVTECVGTLLRTLRRTLPREPIPEPIGEPLAEGAGVGVGVGSTPSVGLSVQSARKRADHDKAIADEFARWWMVYPRKTGKTAALKAYRAARKRATADDLVAALRRQMPDLTRDLKFTPYPASWLNAGRWEDEQPGQAAASGFDPNNAATWGAP